MNIEVKELKKSFGSQISVNQINFSLKSSEIIGFLGPNGAGKSTTLKMMMGLLEPDSGEITFDSIPRSKQSQNLNESIGYLSEQNPLYSEMFVKEFLAFAGALKKVPKEILQKRIEEVIQLTGLTKEKNKRIKELSKGYKQRIGIAQAIINNPPVLILDEPTSGLDPLQMEEIRQLIKKIAPNKTILFSSHILSEVEAICDRVLIIHHGNLVADKTIKEIKSSGSLENFFKKMIN